MASVVAPVAQFDFESLVQAGQQPVMRYLLARTGSAAEAGELAQETFVRAYCALTKGDRPRYGIPWLLTIARNVYVDAVRSQRAERQLHQRMAQTMGFAWQSPWRDRVERRVVIADAIEGHTRWPMMVKTSSRKRTTVASPARRPRKNGSAVRWARRPP